jgi:hypothetical protein
MDRTTSESPAPPRHLEDLVHGEPLSAALLKLFASEATEQRTLNHLLLSLERRGALALVVLLCVPFMTPVSLPGVSNVFGLAIAFLGWRLALGEPAILPPWVGNYRLDGPLLGRVIRAGLAALRWLERGVKPRPSAWVTAVAARRLNGVLLMWGALLLALPLPPTIPCSNLIPAAALILISLSMAEEDGRTIWLGYAAIFGSTAYLTTMIWLQSVAFLKLWHRIQHQVLPWIFGSN